MRRIHLATIIASTTKGVGVLTFNVPGTTVTFSSDAAAAPVLSNAEAQIFAVNRTALTDGVLWQILAVTDAAAAMINASDAPYDTVNVSTATYNPVDTGLSQIEAATSGIQLLSSLIALTKPSR